uniref:Peptidase C1A papain C-terminal domain-containing protein n=1 Tax=Panagrolaimus davidi TaxID=227884 RepID=A0A914PSP6_9BILA
MDFKIFLICAVTSFVIVETSEETPEFDNVTVFVCNVNRCDWRTLAGAIGHPCEACWAFSVISVLVLETFRFRFLSTDEEPLSEQHLLDYGFKFNRLLGRCDSTPGIIEGGDTIAAFGIIRKFGTYRTIDYPWTGKNQDPQPTKGDPAMSGFEYVPHMLLEMLKMVE